MLETRVQEFTEGHTHGKQKRATIDPSIPEIEEEVTQPSRDISAIENPTGTRRNNFG